MSEFNIEDLDAVISEAKSIPVQMLALQLKSQIRKGEQMAKEREALAVECAAAKIALKYTLSGRRDFILATPETDVFLAGIKADGRVEGINFAASRLAAAFNHGFVDKPMAEVFDVVRMILTAKEDLANDPVLAADGLSGEYAEKSLAEWEAALREGAK